MTFRSPSGPFWGSRPGDGARLLLFGAPLDLTGSGLRGTAQGPIAIRQASHNIESYSPQLEGDLFEAGLADLGDVELDGLDLRTALAEIERTSAELLGRGVPIMLGGEHTATLAAFRAVRRAYPAAALLCLDAHLDMADELDGRTVAHGTWAARLGEEHGLEALTLLGVRSGGREEWRRARGCAWSSPDLAMPKRVRQALAGRPIYLSVDIDVLDPSAAPGTGCPEPGGPGSKELLHFLHSLAGLNLVGLDVMEVLPAVDPAGITATVAAKVVRELGVMIGSPLPLFK